MSGKYLIFILTALGVYAVSLAIGCLIACYVAGNQAKCVLIIGGAVTGYLLVTLLTALGVLDNARE